MQFPLDVNGVALPLLLAAIGITESNLSLLKSSKVKGVRFSTLAAICRYLDCEPGDILGYEPSDEDLGTDPGA
ncbi:MAG: hypothetical protein B7Z07_01840 [Sphingomonadales bacterium 32-67-7]|nr:MAG: hypothetical protein B7Z07_01840 [Sphingomonadales bacterium 32-67-7]